MDGDAIKELIGHADLTVCEKVRKCSLVEKNLTTKFSDLEVTDLLLDEVRSCFMYNIHIL